MNYFYAFFTLVSDKTTSNSAIIERQKGCLKDGNLYAHRYNDLSPTLYSLPVVTIIPDLIFTVKGKVVVHNTKANGNSFILN